MRFLSEWIAAGNSPERLIEKAERLAASGKAEMTWSTLRRLPLDTFADLSLQIPADKPALRKLLPSMASDEVQRHWTGNCGSVLMTQSLDFMRSVDQACREHLSHGITGKVLDYGCGWGRLLRLLPWFVNPDKIYGADPWNQSIDICRQHNCPGHLAMCDYVPNSLPFPGPFDLIYAFSVFTHLSEQTTDVVLCLLRKYIADNGMLVITIRPPDYWNVHQNWPQGYSRDLMQQRHVQEGFAFIPHQLEPIDGDITYGDTSMTLEYIHTHWPKWRVAGTAHNESDPMQILVFLLPD